MCLAVALRIVSLEGTNAVCESCGVSRRVRTDLVPHAKVGDYVLSHAGFAIEVLDEEQARLNLEAVQETLDAI